MRAIPLLALASCAMLSATLLARGPASPVHTPSFAARQGAQAGPSPQAGPASPAGSVSETGSTAPGPAQGAAAGVAPVSGPPAVPAVTAPAQVSPTPTNEVPVAPTVEFSTWLAEFVTEARGRGYPDTLLAATFSGMEPLHRVIASDRSQAELNPGFARYLSSRLTPLLIRRGKEAQAQNKAVLARVEQEFGVPQQVLLAIWGVETHYGRVTGSTPIFRALATLAWEPRRADFFRGELYNALEMVRSGSIDAKSMTGSWAGAMGQPQFMPSSYLKYAVDYDKDGRRDIWKSRPDVLASVANYLRGYGWTDSHTWGREVKVPPRALATIAETIPKRPEGCYAIRNMTERVPLSQWNALGVTRADGGPLPTADVAAGLVDVGDRKFLVYPNYDAILGYNCAHYYALSVALLSDAIDAAAPPAPVAKAPTRRPARRRTRR